MKTINSLNFNSLIKNFSKTAAIGFLTIASLSVGSSSLAASKLPDSDQGFLSKQTTEIEFTFAIVTIIGGFIVSERLQKNQEQ